MIAIQTLDSQLIFQFCFYELKAIEIQYPSEFYFQAPAFL